MYLFTKKLKTLSNSRSGMQVQGKDTEFSLDFLLLLMAFA